MLHHRSTRRAAFSLLEVSLVVVIIFLFILALIPVFRSKRVAKSYPVLPPATPAEKHAMPTAMPIPSLKPPTSSAAPAPKATPEPQ